MENLQVVAGDQVKTNPFEFIAFISVISPTITVVNIDSILPVSLQDYLKLLNELK